LIFFPVRVGVAFAEANDFIAGASDDLGASKLAPGWRRQRAVAPTFT
jgi:hypothetical protein